MADDKRRRRRTLAGGAVGTDHTLFEDMTQVLEKLRVLDYEREFCQKHPEYSDRLEYGYFAMTDQANPQGYQFRYFSMLVLWLLKDVIGHDFEAWSEVEEGASGFGNTGITENMVEQMTKLGYEQEIFASKLLNGYGSAVLSVMSFLCDRALEKTGFVPQTPDYPVHLDEDDEVAGDVGADSGEDSMEESDLDSESDSDDDMYMLRGEDDDDEDDEEKHPTQSAVDPKQWELELERVGPKLRLRRALEIKEWRIHLDSAEKHGGSLKAGVPTSSTQLKKIHKDLKAALDKIQSSEERMNKEFADLGSQFRDKQQALEEVTKVYTELDEECRETDKEKRHLQNDVEMITAQITDEKDSAQDVNHLHKIKESLRTLGQEVRELDLRVGVSRQAMLAARRREIKLKQNAQRVKSARRSKKKPRGRRATRNQRRW